MKRRTLLAGKKSSTSGNYSRKIKTPDSMKYGPRKHAHSHSRLADFNPKSWDEHCIRTGRRSLFDRNNPFTRLARI